MKSIAVAFSFLVSALAPAFAAEPLTASEARDTALDLAAKLEEGYLDPATGAAYATMLRSQVGKGAYDDYSDLEAFAEKVTQDIGTVYPDGHLKLKVFKEPSDQGEEARALPPAYEEPRWIADGVVYSKWNVFPSEDNTIAAAKKLMEDYAGATAIIFDLREHHGGRLDEQDVFFSYLFGEPTHLVTMRIRQGKGEFMAEAFDAMPTMKRKPAENGVDIWEHWAAPVKGGSPWSKAKVYLLTSKITASAAEHFTLALKTTGRATLIGERTRGAGNFGGGERIGERFYAFIAVGQTVDPKTGKGWDVVGIEPDIAVPADEALDRALEEIGK